MLLASHIAGATSTGQDTSRFITDQELDALFDWHPLEQILPHPTASHLKQGRSPPFYGKHFRRDLLLLQIKSYPNLLSVLADVADTARQRLRDKDISLPACDGTGFFVPKRRRDTIEMEGAPEINNRYHLGNVYKETTAAYCAPVASMLALHPTHSYWTSVCTWCVPNDDEHAVTNAVFRLKSRFKDSLDGKNLNPLIRQWVEALGDRKPAILEMAHRFPDIITREDTLGGVDMMRLGG
ncbi:hypothetical protein BOTBODRAFT_183198 [Botryobasidium botryosum FD-172 SS1]|uniref:Uncharacterized protein n=1 Tax=Botryobasidium botryosum (strain FD-172 SS1) TaxID=930990 RepID=A0A067N8H5_BOTB1|nr:hypothetical protein BOTBODRAFT_183198 [Botryobasidium botryosum FD-172 SS1]